MIRFEDHHTEARGVTPPQNFVPMLAPGERVLAVETVTDAFGVAAARVWIERADA